MNWIIDFIWPGIVLLFLSESELKRLGVLHIDMDRREMGVTVCGCLEYIRTNETSIDHLGHDDPI